MGRIFYDQKVKDEAIRRYLYGESPGKIAKEMGINSPDLIRKWAQAWRKSHNLQKSCGYSYLQSDLSDAAGNLDRLLRVLFF